MYHAVTNNPGGTCMYGTVNHTDNHPASRAFSYGTYALLFCLLSAHKRVSKRGSARRVTDNTLIW